MGYLFNFDMQIYVFFLKRENLFSEKMLIAIIFIRKSTEVYILIIYYICQHLNSQ